MTDTVATNNNADSPQAVETLATEPPPVAEIVVTLTQQQSLPGVRLLEADEGNQVIEVLPPKRAADAGFVPMTWNHGPIIGWLELVSLYWGDFSQTQIDSMNNYLSGYARYLQSQGAPDGQRCVVWQYGVGGGSVGASYVENAQPRNATEGDVRNLVQQLQGNGNLPAFAANRLFLVFTHGITFADYGTKWCGYHGSWGDGQYFAIIPYPTVGGCGSTAPDSSWQSVTSHEINEAATDPRPGSGWVTGGEEGGDTCAWQEYSLDFGTVQRFEDNLQTACSVWTIKGLFDWSFAGNTLGRSVGDPNFGQIWDG